MYLNLNKPQNKQATVLLSPLSWGIGHAARSVAIVKEIQKQGFQVLLMANKESCFFFKKEIPDTQCIKLPGFSVRYSKFFPLVIVLFLQIPFFLIQILIDRWYIKKAIKKYNIQYIISDNRFGFRHPDIESIYISHQIWIKMPERWKFLEKTASLIHQNIIKKYNKLWIPDYTPEYSIAGYLSAAPKLNIAYEYIGILSRFSKQTAEQAACNYKFIVILSGPEPHRTILEKKLTNFLEQNKISSLIINSIEGEGGSLEYCKKIGLTSSEELIGYINQSEIIISRAGYSSIMDWIRLKKNAVLIPTPQQSEQEYLAKYLAEKRYFFCINEDQINDLEGVDEVLKKYNVENIHEISSK